MGMRAEVRIDTMTESDLRVVAAIDSSTRMGETQLRDELARSWSHVWVARETGVEGIVGFLVAWHVTDELHVLNVTTRADQRRRGIARALMDTAVSYGRERRLKHVLLEVRRSNHGAIALYRGVGFFAIGVRARYYPDDEDAVEMLLLFDRVTGEIVPGKDGVRLDERPR
jgi:[ribosomal protein S18]-alanine N-acetyltransferase